MSQFQVNQAYYFAANPDVFQAWAAGDIPSAEFHYNNYGWVEMRDPNDHFDTSYYLLQNPDVAAAIHAGDFSSPLQHFMLYGAAEGRAPSAHAATAIANFDEDAYLTANPDVAAAVAAGDFANAMQHWQLYGQFEARPGAPAAPGVPGDTFTLTAGLDEIEGTDGDDTVQGISANVTTFDSIDGGAGEDTLNIIGNLTAGDWTGVSVQNVETVNLVSNTDAVDASLFGSAAAQIWQINSAANIDGVSANQTAGFRNVDPAATQAVSVGFTGAEANIALENVNNLEFTIVDEDTGASDVDLTVLNVSGSTGGKLEFGSASLGTIETVNLAISNDTDISVQSATALSGVINIDASASTGGLNVGYAAVTNSALETLVLGSGNDVVGLDLANMDADNLSVTLGAGNDTLDIDTGGDVVAAVSMGEGDDNVTLTGASTSGSLELALGAGNDGVTVDALANIASAAAFEDSMIVISDFNADEDTLDASALGGRDVITNTEQANIAAQASLEDALGVAAGYIDAANGYAVFDYQGDAYILVDNDSGSDFTDNDGLIKLAGVSTADLDASAFVA
ncbi:hypothetical protein AB2N04_16700 [Nitratireductor sp. GISD-1A_MAKvit]|uniref:hypothetical protein n=1 Tax=Nitratireductor sp. GISD-1A_MAKvit TaxID=3234198 RepID=UPI0034653A76